jgi:hypothetical protein
VKVISYIFSLIIPLTSSVACGVVFILIPTFPPSGFMNKSTGSVISSLACRVFALILTELNPPACKSLLKYAFHKTFMLPLTSSLAHGVVVPIPTFPPVATVIDAPPCSVAIITF